MKEFFSKIDSFFWFCPFWHTSQSDVCHLNPGEKCTRKRDGKRTLLKNARKAKDFFKYLLQYNYFCFII